MKILSVISSMDPVKGGLAQSIRNLVPALAARGAHSEVLSFDAPDAGFLGQDDFPIHAIGPAKGPYGYCAALRPWLEENIARFDAVIAQGLWQHNNAGTWRTVQRLRRAHPAAGPRLLRDAARHARPLFPERARGAAGRRCATWWCGNCSKAARSMVPTACSLRVHRR